MPSELHRGIPCAEHPVLACLPWPAGPALCHLQHLPVLFPALLPTRSRGGHEDAGPPMPHQKVMRMQGAPPYHTQSPVCGPCSARTASWAAPARHLLAFGYQALRRPHPLGCTLHGRGQG